MRPFWAHFVIRRRLSPRTAAAVVSPPRRALHPPARGDAALRYVRNAPGLSYSGVPQREVVPAFQLFFYTPARRARQGAAPQGKTQRRALTRARPFSRVL